jgi:hypothetical protein
MMKCEYYCPRQAAPVPSDVVLAGVLTAFRFG